MDVTDIAFQDSASWISSNEGVMRYKAGSFSLFNQASGHLVTDKIKRVSCTALRVWAIGDTSLTILSAQGSIHVNLGRFGTLWDIEAGSNEEAWLASDEGVLRINSSGILVQLLDTLTSGLYPNRVEEIVKAGDGTLWFFSSQSIKGNEVLGGIFYLENGQIKNWRNAHPQLSGCQQRLPGRFRGISSDESGKLYLLLPPENSNTEGLTLMRFSRNEATYFQFPKGNPDLITNEGHILPLADGKVVIFSGSKNQDFKSLWVYDLNVSKSGPDPGIRYLDINQVRAPFSNELQVMHWDLINKKHYEVPAGSCKNTQFGSAIWVGGLVNKQLRIAAETYRQSGRDYYPGPIQVNSPHAGDSLARVELSGIWKISGQDIANMKHHTQNGDLAAGRWLPPADILSWPAQGKGSYSNPYTPFEDINQNGIYEPLLGDYPILKGDQMIFWISNDANGIHSESSSEPLKLEMYTYAYAFNCPDLNDNDPNSILNYTTWYEVQIVNKNSIQIDSMVTGIWQDQDIGYFMDDYIGCNPKGGYCFAYNSKPIDNPLTGFGINPPAQSTLLLSAPGDSNSSSSLKGFHYYENDFSVTGNPSRPEHYWNYLNGRWKDGTPVSYGGNGFGGQDTASFMYCGSDDPTGRPHWSEAGEKRAGGDRRSLLTTRHFCLKPGEKKELKFAMFTSRAPYSGLLNQIQVDAGILRNWFATNTYPACMPWTTRLIESRQDALDLLVFPNPGKVIQARWNTQANRKVQVFDCSGKVVHETEGKSGLEVDLSKLNSGIYLLRFFEGNKSISKRIVVE